MDSMIKVKISTATFDFPGRKKLLLSGRCGGILPFSMISEQGIIRGVYNTSGYRRLSSVGCVPAWDILDIAEKSLECIELCKDWLIYPEEYILSPDTMYIRSDSRKAAITYIPSGSSDNKESSCMATVRFIYSLKRHTTENGCTYLDTLGKMLACSNLRYQGVFAFIEELKRETKIYEII